MKTNISVKIPDFFRRSWLTQILTGLLREEFLPEYFIPGVLLNGSDPCFGSKLRELTEQIAHFLFEYLLTSAI